MSHCDTIPQAVRHTFWEQYPKLHVMASPSQLSEAWSAFEAWASWPPANVTIESIRNKLCSLLAAQGVVTPLAADVRDASDRLYEAWIDPREADAEDEAVRHEALSSFGVSDIAVSDIAVSDIAGLIYDPVNHPRHYTSHPSGIECIEITKHMSFCLGNALKYIWRCDLKRDAIEDLRKAVWYLEQEIAMREAAAEEVEK